MSIKLMSEVWSMHCESATQKIILLKLADNANDEGDCFPSMRTVAKHCGCDRRTVMRHINRFKELGLITTSHRYRDDGSYSSNDYQLQLNPVPSDILSLGAQDHRGRGTGSQGVGAQDHRGRGTGSHHEPSVKPSVKPSGEPKDICVQKHAHDYVQFERVWLQWPSKKNKKKAMTTFASYAKKNRLDYSDFADQLIADIEKRCATQQFGFDKMHFTTYINGERFNDEYSQPQKSNTQARVDNNFDLINSFDLNLEG